MPSITLAQAEQHLSDWLAADLAATKGRHFQLGDRILTMNDAAMIRQNIEFWELRVKRLQGCGGIRIQRPEL